MPGNDDGTPFLQPPLVQLIADPEDAARKQPDVSFRFRDGGLDDQDLVSPAAEVHKRCERAFAQQR